MNRRSLAALILLNSVLLAALVVGSFSSPVQAQFGAAGNYMMIAGQVRGRTNQNAIYIIDQQTSQMVSMMFNSANNEFEYFAARRISDDARSGAGVGGR
ncbi:MAG: hypothetical protein IT445_14500 [Phycisphaeraceae bacterium]|nr:hypothetical protein [Phycisphaeraceae bacterium]